VAAPQCEDFSDVQVLRNVGLLHMCDGSVTVKFENQGDYVPVPLLLETAAGLPATPDESVPVSHVFAEGEVLVYRGLSHYGALATVLQSTSENGTGMYAQLHMGACSVVYMRG
jgi:hypothetical protein